jgi:hypothetical protein
MRHDQTFNSINVQNAAQRLGERIRTARKAQRRSLVDLESACRVHRQTLHVSNAEILVFPWRLFECA